MFSIFWYTTKSQKLHNPSDALCFRVFWDVIPPFWDKLTVALCGNTDLKECLGRK